MQRLVISLIFSVEIPTKANFWMHLVQSFLDWGPSRGTVDSEPINCVHTVEKARSSFWCIPVICTYP